MSYAVIRVYQRPKPRRVIVDTFNDRERAERNAAARANRTGGTFLVEAWAGNDTIDAELEGRAEPCGSTRRTG